MKITFFGHSAWGLEAAGRRVLVDPYPVSPAAADLMSGFVNEACDLILVTHAGADHLGIALDLARAAEGALLVSDLAVVELARRTGLPKERCEVLGWNSDKTYQNGWHVRGLETKHWSVVKDPYIVGFPLAFLIDQPADPEIRLLHLGDTSIFSDLALFGQLYGPTVALIGVGGARPGKSGHMTPAEAALACLWLGVDVALPMHFPGQPEVAEAFCAAVRAQPRPMRTWVPELGTSFTIERETRITSQ